MTDMGARVVAAARGWIGTPYRHQATCRGAGCDCLGLLRGVWREVLGAEPCGVPAYSRDWAEPAAVEALLEAAGAHLEPAGADTPAPGQVIVFRMRAHGIAKHVGIQAQVGPDPTFIHAFERHGVVESPLSAPWARRIAGRFRFPERIR